MWKSIADNRLYILILVLFIPASTINLGLLTFIDDEAIRALVALEMDLSGNWITPTIHGEYYYNKPPLFNWLLSLFFPWLGYTEFTSRLVNVLCLWGFTATIFGLLRKEIGSKQAFWVALATFTCGRILFWDSMLGLIDTCFSWVVFVNFYLIFFFARREDYWKMFLFSYILTAIAFLLKGLPAVVFQGITLLSYLLYKRQWKQLFSPAHISGGILFVFLIGIYYFIYHQFNPLETVFRTLFTESTKRTVVRFGIGETIKHLFTFPFEMLYHFVPWSLFSFFLWRKDVLVKIKQDPLIVYFSLIFIANIIIYWTSPEVYPRYLLMLVPVYFTILFYFEGIHRESNTRLYRIFVKGFGIMLFLLSWVFLPTLLLERTQNADYLIFKAVGLTLALLATAWGYQKNKADAPWLYLILFLLIFRVGFNWFVLPDRNANDFGASCRTSSLEAGMQFRDTPLFVYKETAMQPTNSYYLTRGRMAIIPVKADQFSKDALYIIDPLLYPDLEYEKVSEIKVRHGQLTYDIGYLK
jgi:4-amino-4-deoxy-L-arabinose transferase-like glycosyltransferase